MRPRKKGEKLDLKRWTTAASIIAILLISLSGCKQETVETLKQENLFELAIGKMEDQLSYFQLEGKSSRRKTSICMKDGLFYISNGEAQKVMKFNSYGDIIALYYNPEENPQPILLSVNKDSDTVSNKAAFPYPFREVGDIAVTPDRRLLVQDRVIKERAELDEERGAMLDQVVLRFDRKGELIDYLGQEGVGGTPFPYIDSLQISSGGEIVVFTRSVKTWTIYWYTSDGTRMYTVDVLHDKLPVPEEEGIIANLDTIFADPDSHYLYLKIDYYINKIAQSTKAAAGIDYFGSRIYTLDLEAERYTRHIGIPKHYITQDDLAVLEMEKEEVLYEFIGVASGGYFFLLAPDEGSYYQLLILDLEGRVVERTRIVLKDSEILYRTFYLDPSGILSALLCEEEKAKVVWWRSDKLLEQEREVNKTE